MSEEGKVWKNEDKKKPLTTTEIMRSKPIMPTEKEKTEYNKKEHSKVRNRQFNIKLDVLEALDNLEGFTDGFSVSDRIKFILVENAELKEHQSHKSNIAERKIIETVTNTKEMLQQHFIYVNKRLEDIENSLDALGKFQNLKPIQTPQEPKFEVIPEIIKEEYKAPEIIQGTPTFNDMLGDIQYRAKQKRMQQKYDKDVIAGKTFPKYR